MALPLPGQPSPLLEWTTEELRASLREYSERFMIPIARELAEKLKAELKARERRAGKKADAG